MGATLRASGSADGRVGVFLGNFFTGDDVLSDSLRLPLEFTGWWKKDSAVVVSTINTPASIVREGRRAWLGVLSLPPAPPTEESVRGVGVNEDAPPAAAAAAPTGIRGGLTSVLLVSKDVSTPRD